MNTPGGRSYFLLRPSPGPRRIVALTFNQTLNVACNLSGEMECNLWISLNNYLPEKCGSFFIYFIFAHKYKRTRIYTSSAIFRIKSPAQVVIFHRCRTILLVQ